MKKVIICEGFNDGLFMESLVSKLGFHKTKIKIFKQLDVSIEEKKDAETRILRSFIDDNSFNPYDILIKLEGGKDSAIKLFSRELVYSLRKIDNLILILDIDNSNFEGKKNLIKDMVNKIFGQTIPLELNFKEKNQNKHLHHSSCKVTINGTKQEVGEFQMVLFKNNLENVCGIVNKKDTEEDKRIKIEKLITENKLPDFFSQIIN